METKYTYFVILSFTQ